MNKKDFAICKIYLSYCYKTRQRRRGKKETWQGRGNVWMLLPSLFDLEDVHCAARSCWYFHLEIRTSRYASCYACYGHEATVAVSP